MARVEIRPSGGHSYAVVVEDLQEGGQWKKKVIRSFGNISDPSRLEAAEQFANAVNAGQYLKALGMTEAELKRTLGYVVTGAALGLVIGFLARD